MIKMQEPIWGQNFLKSLNSVMASNENLVAMMPVLADVFVFTYPVYLVALYLYGIIKKEKTYKEFALLLFVAGFASIAVNLVIQFFVEKTRPDVVLDLALEARDALFLEHLPSDTFPSDHTAMAFAIAFTTLFRGISQKKKGIIYLSLLFIVFGVVMGYARISMGIHWPTDILVGALVGITVSFVFTRKKIADLLSKTIFKWIINLQEIIFGRFSKKK